VVHPRDLHAQVSTASRRLLLASGARVNLVPQGRQRFGGLRWSSAAASAPVDVDGHLVLDDEAFLLDGAGLAYVTHVNGCVSDRCWHRAATQCYSFPGEMGEAVARAARYRPKP
jgi:hypothetical protein